MAATYRNPSPARIARIGAPVALGAAAVAVAVGLLLWGARNPVSPRMLAGSGITLLFLAFWTTRLVNNLTAAIAFFVGALAVAGFPAEVVFSGFYASAAWLLLGALILGHGAREAAGLDRLGPVVARFAGRSYMRSIFGIVAIAGALIFVVPAPMVRVMVILPIAAYLAETTGFEPGSRGRNGMLLAAALAGSLPGAAVLPSSLSGLAMSGTAASVFGVSIGYGRYLAANFPVLGMGTLIVIALLASRMFSDSPRLKATHDDAGAASNSSPLGLAVLAAVVVLWISDGWHGVDAGWIALAGCLAWLAISANIRNGPIAAHSDTGVWLVFAAILGMAAVINQSGLGKALGDFVVDAAAIEPGDDFPNYAKLIAVGLVAAFLTTVTASPAVVATMAQSLATATGWPLETVLLAQAPTWIFIVFPFQAPLLLAALTAARVPIRQAVRLLAVLSALGLLVLVPLHYFWLQTLGYIA